MFRKLSFVLIPLLIVTVLILALPSVAAAQGPPGDDIVTGQASGGEDDDGDEPPEGVLPEVWADLNTEKNIFIGAVIILAVQVGKILRIVPDGWGGRAVVILAVITHGAFTIMRAFDIDYSVAGDTVEIVTAIGNALVSVFSAIGGYLGLRKANVIKALAGRG